MSKQRARLRAAREAQAAAQRAARARRAARRARLQRILRALRPRWPDRRTGSLLRRRPPGQRTAIGLVILGALALIWTQLDGLALRLALSALVLLAAPAFILLALGRDG